MESEVGYYCEDYNDVNFAMLSAHFGNPEDVARDFIAELGESTITKSNSVKQRLLHLTFAVLILAAVLVASMVTYTHYKQQQTLDVHYIESITYEADLSSGATGPTYWVEYQSVDED